MFNTKASIPKYSTLLTLYLAQSIPMTFFASVLPVIMRMEHYSLTSIGLLQLIKLPWLLKFLWAPLVDKSNGDLNRYKKWIFSSEIFYAIVIFSTALLDLQTDFKLIIVLLLIAFTASATQDIATDAFAYLVLEKKQRSFGSSIQTIGSFLGTLIGSGLLLIIYHYFGWKYLVFSLGAFVLLAIIPLRFYKPKPIKLPTAKSSINLKDIYTFFKQKGIGKQVLLLSVFYSGIIGILTMQKPWLVDLGYSVKDIGIFSGIYGPLGGVLFALLSGFLIRKIGLTHTFRIIFIFSISVSFLFWRLSQITPDYIFLQMAIIGIWSVYSMGSVFVYTLIMNNIRDGREGTDFTLQIVIAHIGSMIIAIGSGKLAHSIGYDGLFFIEMCINIAMLTFFTFYYKNFKL